MEYAICMRDYTSDGEHIPCVLSCGHTFGRSCLRNALTCRRECPTCRAQIECAFSEIPKNYVVMDILSKSVPRSETSTLDACIVGSLKLTAEVRRDINHSKSELDRVMKQKLLENGTLIARVSATESSIAKLKQHLKVGEANLLELKAAVRSSVSKIGIKSPDANNLRRFQRLEDVAGCKSYRLKTQELCTAVMKESFLAFYQAQTSFDSRSLLKRIREIDEGDECRSYVVSMLKLEYHCRIPSAANTFNIWELLDIRMRLRHRRNEVGYRDLRYVCTRLIDMHPNVSMGMHFCCGRSLDVPLHSTIEWVLQKINRTFNHNSSAAPRQLFCGFKNMSAESGKLFDQDIVAKTVFSLSRPRITIIVYTVEPNVLDFKMFAGAEEFTSIYEVKQMISDKTAPPYLQTISCRGTVLSDEKTVREYGITAGCTLRVAVRPDDVSDYMVFGASTTGKGVTASSTNLSNPFSSSHTSSSSHSSSSSHPSSLSHPPTSFHPITSSSSTASSFSTTSSLVPRTVVTLKEPRVTRSMSDQNNNSKERVAKKPKIE